LAPVELSQMPAQAHRLEPKPDRWRFFSERLLSLCRAIPSQALRKAGSPEFD
jgi:hypothetical protein